MNKELLKQCRWYKGEDSWEDSILVNSPNSPSQSFDFWAAEELWVRRNGHADLDGLSCLVTCGLSDGELIKKGAPAEALSVPLSLRAFIFARMNHYSGLDPIEMARYFIPAMEAYLSGQAGSISI